MLQEASVDTTTYKSPMTRDRPLPSRPPKRQQSAPTDRGGHGGTGRYPVQGKSKGKGTGKGKDKGTGKGKDKDTGKEKEKEKQKEGEDLNGDAKETKEEQDRETDMRFDETMATETMATTSAMRMMECCICLEEHAVLRQLSCTHSLCFYCLVAIASRDQTASSDFECPICRFPHSREEAIHGKEELPHQPQTEGFDPSLRAVTSFLRHALLARELPSEKWMSSFLRLFASDGVMEGSMPAGGDDAIEKLMDLSLVHSPRLASRLAVASGLFKGVRRVSILLSRRHSNYRFVYDSLRTRLPSAVVRDCLKTAEALGIEAYPATGARTGCEFRVTRATGLHLTLTTVEAEDGSKMNLLQYHMYRHAMDENGYDHDGHNHDDGDGDGEINGCMSPAAFERWLPDRWLPVLVDLKHVMVLAIATTSVRWGLAEGVKGMDALFEQARELFLEGRVPRERDRGHRGFGEDTDVGRGGGGSGSGSGGGGDGSDRANLVTKVVEDARALADRWTTIDRARELARGMAQHVKAVKRAPLDKLRRIYQPMLGEGEEGEDGKGRWRVPFDRLVMIALSDFQRNYQLAYDPVGDALVHNIT